MRVTLPLALPGVIAAAVIVFIPTIGDYVTPKACWRPKWVDDLKYDTVAISKSK